VTHPRNAAVSTNDAATFTCATGSTSSDPVPLWWNIAVGARTLQKPAIEPLCNVNDAGARVCNLIVNSTQLTNAGTYLCQVLQDFSTAELVVLGKCSSAF